MLDHHWSSKVPKIYSAAITLRIDPPPELAGLGDPDQAVVTGQCHCYHCDHKQVYEGRHYTYIPVLEVNLHRYPLSLIVKPK